MKTVTITEQPKIDEVIRSCQFCFVAVADVDATPYVFPMNFGYRDGILYLHSGPQGRKTDILEKNPKVCISFCANASLYYTAEQIACTYLMQTKSVIIDGQVEFIADDAEKIRIMNIIMAHYTAKTDFQYSDPAIKNVRVWKVQPTQVTCRFLGVPHREAMQLEKTQHIKKNV